MESGWESWLSGPLPLQDTALHPPGGQVAPRCGLPKTELSASWKGPCPHCRFPATAPLSVQPLPNTEHSKPALMSATLLFNFF